MAVGHGALVGTVRLGSLSLSLLVGRNPGVAWCGCWGCVGRGGRCGSRRGDARVVHVHGLLDDLLDDLLHDDLLDHDLGLARGIGLGQVHRASFWRVGLAVVAAVELQDELGLGDVARVAGRLKGRPQRAQVHLDAGGCQTSDAGKQAVTAELALAVELDGGEVAALENAANELGQHTVRADLDEGPDARGVHGLDLLDEANRVGNLVAEQAARRLGSLGVGLGLGVAVHLESGLVELDVTQELAKGLGRRADDLAVEGGGDVQALGSDAFGGELALDVGNGVGRAADDHLLGAVVIGDDDVGAPLGEQGLEGLDGGDHGRHGAGVAGGFGHQLAALAADLEQVGLGEHAGSVQSGDFAVAMSRDGLGLDAQVAHDVEQSQAGDTDGRLGPLGGGQLGELCLLVSGGVGRNGEDDAVQFVSTPDVGAGGLIPGVECCVPCGGDSSSHAQVLAALTGEEEGGLAIVLAGAEVHAVRAAECVSLRDEVCSLAELCSQIGIAVSHDGQACGRLGIEGFLGRAGQEQQHAGLVGDACKLACLGSNGRWRGSAEKDDLGTCDAAAPCMRVGPRVLLEGEVEVRATEAEAGHASATWMCVGPDPRGGHCVQEERAGVDVDLGVGLVDLDGRRKHLVVQGHDGLEQTGGTSGGLGVTHLGLHRAEGAVLAVLAAT